VTNPKLDPYAPTTYGDTCQTWASPVGYRTWIDVTGRYRTVARIVSVKNNMIRLQKQDGDFVLFPLDRLSQADVRFVRRWYPVSQ
jgi:hypothetical protein